MEIHAVLRPAQSQAFLASFRAWIDNHTDQAVVLGSLVIGLWLIVNSLSLIL
jgi:hypothetical protein